MYTIAKFSVAVSVFALLAHGAIAAPCYEPEYVPEAIACAEAINDGFADFQGSGCQIVPAHIIQVEVSCDVVIDVTSSRGALNILDLFEAAHPGEWVKSEKNKILNIHPGVIVGTTSGEAVVIGGSWQGTLTLNVLGEIQGFGGAGNGGSGGNAINANTSGAGGVKMVVNVASTGAIRGGGGGGGRGGNGGTGGTGYYHTTSTVREPTSGYTYVAPRTVQNPFTGEYSESGGIYWNESRSHMNSNDDYRHVAILKWNDIGASSTWVEGMGIHIGKGPSSFTVGEYTYYPGSVAGYSNGTQKHSVYRTATLTSTFYPAGGSGGSGGSGGAGRGYAVVLSGGASGAVGAAGGSNAGAGGRGGNGGAGGDWGTAGGSGLVGAVGGWGNYTGNGAGGAGGSAGGGAGAAIRNSHNVVLNITPGGEINGAR